MHGYQPEHEEPPLQPRPHSEEFERGVLGCVIVDAKSILPLCSAAGMAAVSFYVPAHQGIYQMLCAMHDQGQPIDLLTIGIALKAAGKLDQVGGPPFLERLVDGALTVAYAAFYIDNVMDLAARRGLISETQQVLELACEKAGPDAAFLSDLLVKAANKVIRKIAVETVDAARWISVPPPPTDPVLLETFDLGDKIPIIGSSKSRKSFFSLQLALMLASGRDFLRWRTARPFRVLIIQFEVKEAHYWRRVYNLARALDVTPEALGDRLQVASWRGHEVKPGQILALARKHRAQVIVIDPLYKLVTGDENLAVDMKPVLAGFDQLADATGAAILYVHHNPKGKAGDRDARDRGAGSGVLARDFDAAIYLTDHKEDGLLVCETLLRNYAPQGSFTLEWEAGSFVVRDDLEPVLRTSKNHQASGRTGAALTDDDALAVVAATPLSGKLFLDALRQRGFSKRGAEVARERLVKDGKLAQFSPPVFQRSIYFGTPEQIEIMKRKFLNPSLPGVK